MAKNKKRQGGKAAGSNSASIVLRELEKGNAKDALKQAKLLVRGAPLPDHRVLLERAYLGRIQQLVDRRQLPEGRAILRELLSLNPTHPDVLAGLPRLKIVLGETVDESTLFQQNPAMLTEICDQAVLDSQLVAPTIQGLDRQVESVRGALVDVEQQRWDEAIAKLKEIPRQSPLSDWRMFVRGLIAFYQRDEQRQNDNWQRLDSERSAFQIAQTLLAASDQPHQPSSAVSSSLKRLMYATPGNQSVVELRRLVDIWESDERQKFPHALRSFIEKYKTSQPELVEALTDFAWREYVEMGNEFVLRIVSRSVQGPSHDPHWRRALVLLRESVGEDPRELWNSVFEEVPRLACFTEDERSIATALIHVHIARQCREQLRILRSDERFDSLVDGVIRDGIRHFQDAAKFWPSLKSAYAELVDLYQELERSDEAMETLEKAVRQFPDDFDLRVRIASVALGADKLDEAEPHLAAASRLKPRDPILATLKINRCLSLIGHLTRKRQFEAAREQVAEYRELTSRIEDVPSFYCDLIAAAVEYKAKRESAAEEFVRRAEATLVDPTPAWAYLTSLAVRYRLPKGVKDLYVDRMQAGLNGKPRSETVGELARLLRRMQLADVQYTGRYTLERLTLAYAERMDQAKFHEGDLLDLMHWLYSAPRWRHALERFAHGAVKRFPDHRWFQYFAGGCEIERGGRARDVQFARWCLTRAYDQFAKAETPEEQAVYYKIEKMLEALDFDERRSLFGPIDVDDDDMDDWYEDDMDDEEMGENEAAGAGSGADPRRFATMMKWIGDLPDESIEALLGEAIPPSDLASIKRFIEAQGLTLGQYIAQGLSGEAPQ
ncbi:MAG: tetratricopeptide repeat protein [Planctomycetales bacterium]|nr:tetratricopeptide repeat protein [Planctomycetales bacterium]